MNPIVDMLLANCEKRYPAYVANASPDDRELLRATAALQIGLVIGVAKTHDASLPGKERTRVLQEVAGIRAKYQQYAGALAASAAFHLMPFEERERMRIHLLTEPRDDIGGVACQN